jgi:hypothetical protein
VIAQGGKSNATSLHCDLEKRVVVYQPYTFGHCPSGHHSIPGGALLTDYGAHSRLVRQMTEEGQTAVAVIDFVSRENDRIFVDYSDDQDNLRDGVLGMRYYDPVLWETLTPDTTVQIRYLPVHESGSDRVVLQQYFDDVLSYRGYLSAESVGVMLGAWLLIIAKPRCLYLGFIEFEELFKGVQL